MKSELLPTDKEPIKIINDDCLEVLKRLPDNCVDLVLTDPPYGVRKKEDWDDFDNFIKNINIWINECYRVSKNGVIWFCAGQMLPYILKNKEDMFHRILFWDKPAGSQFNGASNNNLWYSTECILVFEKGELRKKGKDSKYGYGFFQARTHKFDDFKHPTAKPYLLMQWLVKHYSDIEDIILDPFAGSGSTGVVCKQLGRKFIGIELDSKHIETIKKRLQQGVL